MDTGNTESVNPAAACMGLITGFWVSAAVYATAKLSIADYLKDGPVSAEALAEKTDTDPASLYRLLRALAGVGVFSETGPRSFALTPVGNHLRSDVPGSLRAFAILGHEIGWMSWSGLGYTLKTGKTAFEHVHGKEYYAYLKENPEHAELFGEAMTGFVSMNGMAVAKAYDFKKLSSVVDVGGGQGALMSAILKASPSVKGVVFDLPEAAEGARMKLEREGLSGRCDFMPGDFFASVPSGAGAYILASVLHNWDDEKGLAILRNCRKAMTENAVLLVVEMVIPQGDAPFFGKLLDLNMMVNLGGRERTEAEYNELLSGAGFKLARVIPTFTPSSLIEAVPV